jgi:CDP-2,3-bis-(O-geranylgeranyl)-sn-glycerol synthase
VALILSGKLLCLLAVANGTPVFATRFAGQYLSFPIDFGIRAPDGHPLLGKSKTVRGLILAIVATAACGVLLGLGWRLGALVGGTSMAGDLLSSFVKRRLHRPVHSRATGLDQIPESLLPLLACRQALSLTLPSIVTVIVAFVLGEMLVSRVLYAWHIRDRPY